MKIKVTVEGHTFDVEVGDLSAEPVIATVDGERFEVWLKNGVRAQGSQVDGSAPANSAPNVRPSNLQPASLSTSSGQAVLAPIPGVIVSVAVQPGQVVKTGQELCVLEAMKMKNVIRAPRDGVIAAVRVAVGQTVQHKDVLVEY
jgi:biotin carboxyl carrier protein